MVIDHEASAICVLALQVSSDENMHAGERAERTAYLAQLMRRAGSDKVKSIADQLARGTGRDQAAATFLKSLQ